MSVIKKNCALIMNIYTIILRILKQNKKLNKQNKYANKSIFKFNSKIKKRSVLLVQTPISWAHIRWRKVRWKPCWGNLEYRCRLDTHDWSCCRSKTVSRTNTHICCQSNEWINQSINSFISGDMVHIWKKSKKVIPFIVYLFICSYSIIMVNKDVRSKKRTDGQTDRNKQYLGCRRLNV